MITKKNLSLEDDLDDDFEEIDHGVDDEGLSVLENVYTRFNFDSVVDELNPDIDLSIDNSDIQYEFSRQPKLAAGYGYLFALAEAEESKQDFNLDLVKSNLSKSIRSKLAKEGVKATEKLIEAEILITEEYKKAKLTHIESQKHKRVYRAALTAVEHKLQGLISAGATQRFNQSPVIKKQDDDGFERIG